MFNYIFAKEKNGRIAGSGSVWQQRVVAVLRSGRQPRGLAHRTPHADYSYCDIKILEIFMDRRAGLNLKRYYLHQWRY